MVGPSHSRVSDVESSAGVDPLLRLHREIDRLFGDMLRDPGRRGAQATTAITPPINISETDQAIYLDAELPGVCDEDVRVDLFGDRLTVHGEKACAHADAERHLAECSFGTFSRTVRLPFSPRPEDVRATFEDGVLHVVLSKPTAQAGTHRIPVHRVSAERTASSATRGCFGGNAALAGHPTEATAQCGTAPAAPVPRPSQAASSASGTRDHGASR